METKTETKELTLDPSDWARFRSLAHKMVDDILDHLSTLRDQPAWREMPESVRTSFHEPLPLKEEGAEVVYEQFLERILPYPNGNLHPRFWGWVQGNGTPLAMMAEMLASAMNPHMAGFNQAPALVEHQVLRWLAELMGMPDSSGVLVTGGTMANILGVAVARHAKAGFDIREEGLQGGRPRMTIYGSTETHGWVRKATDFLGLGRISLRLIPVDDDYCIDLAALRRSVQEDRESGYLPFCVIGNAGTINTGAIDDISGMAKFCRKENLWFHVDGAYGALALHSPILHSRVAGIEEADSVAFDLHKWGYLPFEVACVLIRDRKAHENAFTMSETYLAETKRGVIAGGLPFANRGLDLTRNFKALKVWMSFKAHGIDTFTHLIEQNVRQARYLADLVEAHRTLELIAPVQLNVVCFRFILKGISNEKLNAFNEEILLRIQEMGIAVPQGIVLRGIYCIRAAIVNHRSRQEDFDTLVQAVNRIGQELAKDMQP